MFRHVLQKELADILGSPRFIVIFGVSVLLVVLSVAAGCLNFRIQQQDYSALHSLNQKRLREMITSNNWNRVARGYYVNRAPEVLGVFVHGIEGNRPRRSFIEQKVDVKPTDSRFSDSPLSAVFGVLDLTFIVKVVLSLVVILLTYDAVSGEKEGGTLRLLSSYPVPKDLLILGKGAAILLCLGVTFLVPVLLGLLLVTLFPDVQLRGEDWARLVLILGTFLLYLAVFVSLGLFVSSLTHRSSVSFLVLLSVWVVCTMVVPRVSALTANRLVSVQSPYEYETEKRRIHHDLEQGYWDRRVAWYKQTLPGMNWSQWMATVQDTTTSVQLRETHAQLVNDARLDWHSKEQHQVSGLIERNRNRFRQKARLAMGFSRISPVTSMSAAVADLARTGIAQDIHYRDVVRAYQVEYLNYYDTEKIDYWFRVYVPDKYGKPEVDLGTLPLFTYRSEPLSDTLGRIWFDLVLLAVMGVALFAGAYVRFLKYDVR